MPDMCVCVCVCVCVYAVFQFSSSQLPLFLTSPTHTSEKRTSQTQLKFERCGSYPNQEECRCTWNTSRVKSKPSAPKEPGSFPARCHYFPTHTHTHAHLTSHTRTHAPLSSAISVFPCTLLRLHTRTHTSLSLTHTHTHTHARTSLVRYERLPLDAVPTRFDPRRVRSVELRLPPERLGRYSGLRQVLLHEDALRLVLQGKREHVVNTCTYTHPHTHAHLFTHTLTRTRGAFQQELPYSPVF